MPWWNKILQEIKEGDGLYTPGRGPHGARRSSFEIVSCKPGKIIIASGKSIVIKGTDLFF